MAKYLYVWFQPFSDVMNGGGQVNRSVYMLAKRTEEFDSYYINKTAYSKSLSSVLLGNILMPFGYFNGLTKSKVDKIAEMSIKYDCVYLTSSLMGIVAKRLRDVGYKGKIITLFHNVEEEYFRSILSAKRLDRNMKIRSARHNDYLSCVYADTVITLNERDSRILQKKYNRSADSILPVMMEDRLPSTQNMSEALTCSTPLCTFIGSNFKANTDGILWFVHNVLPHVNIRFRIVGIDMDKFQEQHASLLADVEVVSNASDLYPYYQQSDFIIAPVFAGSGMKVKTCEALMYGKNIIGTDETFEGYDVDSYGAGCRCNTAQEYIDAIREYAKHPIPVFNTNARRLFVERHRLV